MPGVWTQPPIFSCESGNNLACKTTYYESSLPALAVYVWLRRAGPAGACRRRIVRPPFHLENRAKLRRHAS